MSLDKNVPQIRFKGFAGEWVENDLGGLAEIVRGASPRPIDDPKWFDTNSSVGWLRIRDVTEQDGRIHYLEQRISKLGQEKTRVLFEQHLLLSIAASVGKPVINYVETGVHDGFLIFKKPRFYLEFMYQWLKSFEENWQQYGQPGSQVNLNSDIVKNQIVSIPQEKEQTQIGNYFQKLDNLINQHQQKHDKLSSIKKAMLEKMFPKKNDELRMMNAEGGTKGNSSLSTHHSSFNVPEIRFKGFGGEWQSVTLSNVIDIRSGKDYKHLGKGCIPVYGTGGYMLSVDSALSFDEDAIGIGRKGTIDKPYILRAPFWTVDTLFYVVPISSFKLNFLFCLFQKIDWKRHDESTGVPSLSKVAINNVPIYVTSEKEQIKIGNYFQKLDTLINQHQQQITKLNNIKQACLSKMFAG